VIGGASLVGACIGLCSAFADGCATEFVAPLMYARRYSVRDGFGDLWGYARADAGGFLVYLALRFVAALAIAMIAGLLACLTCGLVLVPYVGTLLLLPALVFVRAYALAFVGQLSEDLALALRT
jgi:hypothetical protein